jgi:hypothetical protein
MPFNIEHPVILLITALVCSPALIPLAKFFVDDWETFLEELGYRERDDIWWKMIRIEMHSSVFFLKILLMLTCFGILVGLTYATAVRVFT